MEEEEVRKREEALTLEAVERSLELEQLEMRERQAAQAEDVIGAREARVEEEVDRRVAEVRADLEGGYDLKLKLAGVEDEGRAAALRPRLDEAERRAEATAAALVTAQAVLASAASSRVPSGGGLMTQWPSRGKTRRRCSSDERWSASMPLCFRISGTGPISPWAIFATWMCRPLTRMIMPAS